MREVIRARRETETLNKEKTMTEFDYVSAHRDLVTPLWEALPEKFARLMTATAVVAKDAHQDQSDLSLPWPETVPRLRTIFEDLALEDPAGLALASHVIYYYGHLAPSGKGEECFQLDGAYWKFSMWADAALTSVLFAPKMFGEEKAVEPRLKLKVEHGMLRLTFYNEVYWSGENVGPATPEALAKLRECLGDALTEPKPAIKENQHRALQRDLERFEEQRERVRALRLPSGISARPTPHEQLNGMAQPGSKYLVDKLPPEPQSRETMQRLIESTLWNARHAFERHALEYRETTLLPLCKKHRITYCINDKGNPQFVDSDGIDLDLDDCEKRFPEMAAAYEVLDHEALAQLLGDPEKRAFGIYVRPITREDLK